MQLQQRTIVVNRISKVASGAAAPYKILACPVRHPSERVMGVLALFNPPSAADFDSHQTRIAELLAKKATIIIQSQYDSSTGLMTRHRLKRTAYSIWTSTDCTSSTKPSVCTWAMTSSSASPIAWRRRCRAGRSRRESRVIDWRL
jgi:hypothetical protein